MTTEQVNGFINKISASQRLYVRHCITFGERVAKTIEEFNITDKADFCRKMEIKPSQYNAFLRGGFNYSVNHMASFEAWYYGLLMEKKSKEAEKEAEVVKIGKD